MVEISIVIPSFNTNQLLDECLASLFKETKSISQETIVVDNGSTDNTVAMIRKKYVSIKLISNKKNYGFAKAINQGLKIARGENILLLNSDTVIKDKAINIAIDYLKLNKNKDILGCKLLNPDGSVQPSGGFLPNLWQVFCWMFFLDELPILNCLMKPYQQSRKDFYRKTQELGWITGAFMLIKRKVFDTIGGFDEQFFMYGEEVEWCYRAKKAGFTVWYYPKAYIIHHKGKSSLRGFEIAVLGEYQGIKKIYVKHKSALLLILLRTFLKVGAMIRVMIFGILLNNREKRLIYEKAFKMA